MKKRAHILKKNASAEMPTRFVFFDTETEEHPFTDETELLFKIGTAYFFERGHEGKWIVFDKPNLFWHEVERFAKTKKKTYLIAHNIAFDMRVLAGFDYLKQNGWITKKLIFNGTTNIWTFRKDKRTICFLDNMNFFKSSLKVLGHSIGIEKMEMPTTDLHKLIEYCKNDVLIMVKAWEVFLVFLETHDLGNFAPTIAGQAFNAFRHRFMPTEIFIHNNDAAISLERASYHGGRTECFYIGRPEGENFYMLDVNSMYPSVMRELEYPKKLVRIEPYLNVWDVPRLLERYCLTAEVWINTDRPVFPLKENGKLIFPTGFYKTVLSSRELEYAYRENMLWSVDTAMIYEKDNLFKKYVDHFYNLRLGYKAAKNEAFSYICKLFLNSLYGKFGQRNEKYESMGECSDDDGVFEYFDMEKNAWVKERRINGRAERSIGFVEGHNSFVAIAAHITADARMRLWEYLELAGRDNVFYSDTDSMIVNVAGYEKCKGKISKCLGDLDLKDEAGSVEIRGAKDYVFGEAETIKGIRKDAERLSENTFRQVKFEGLAGAIRKNRMNRMFISDVVKTLRREYDKGIVTKTGRVIPFQKTDDKIVPVPDHS